jgi:hypothetical protein
MATTESKSNYKAQLEEEGFVIIPGLISPEDSPRLEKACDHVITRTRDGSWTHRRTVGKQFPPFGDEDSDSWGVQHVMHPDLKEPVFSEWYTSTALINTVQALLSCQEEELQMGLLWASNWLCFSHYDRIIQPPYQSVAP